LNIRETAVSEEVVVPLEAVEETYSASGHAGYGSTDTKIAYMTTVNTNTISGLGTVTNDATNGWVFTASKAVKFTIYYTGTLSGTTDQLGASVNSSQLTTNILNITNANRFAYDILEGEQLF